MPREIEKRSLRESDPELVEVAHAGEAESAEGFEVADSRVRGEARAEDGVGLDCSHQICVGAPEGMDATEGTEVRRSALMDVRPSDRVHLVKSASHV